MKVAVLSLPLLVIVVFAIAADVPFGNRDEAANMGGGDGGHQGRRLDAAAATGGGGGRWRRAAKAAAGER